MALNELLSKLLVSPLITPIVVPYIIPYVTTFKEFRLWLKMSAKAHAGIELSERYVELVKVVETLFHGEPEGA